MECYARIIAPDEIPTIEEIKNISDKLLSNKPHHTVYDFSDIKKFLKTGYFANWTCPICKVYSHTHYINKWLTQLTCAYCGHVDDIIDEDEYDWLSTSMINLRNRELSNKKNIRKNREKIISIFIRPCPKLFPKRIYNRIINKLFQKDF